MAIPQWIKKTASEVEEKGAPEKLTSPAYKKLNDMYRGGKLDEWMSQAMEEVENILGVVNHAVSQLDQKLEVGLSKIAAPKEKEEKEKPLDFGDERLVEEMTPEHADEEVLPGAPSRKLPPKMKEPETTKWKEIRFNKRTGTWQCVITIRHTRNFLSEDEAVEFTKKASKE